MNYLIVVDMQNDFIDGSLGSAMAQAIVPKVVEKAAHFDGKVIFTRDTHGPNYLNTQEGRKLPVKHCIPRLADLRGAPALRRQRGGQAQLWQHLPAPAPGPGGYPGIHRAVRPVYGHLRDLQRYDPEKRLPGGKGQRRQRLLRRCHRGKP